MPSSASASKRIVLSTFGSFGDVHPYLALALELKARGHRPCIATSELYREKVAGEGLEFAPVRPDLPAPHEAPELLAKVMDERDGTRYLFQQLIMPGLRASYADMQVAARGADLLVTHPITFAAPMVAELMDIPWVSTVLSPISFFSAHDPAILLQGPLFRLLLRGGPTVMGPLLQLARRRIRPWFGPLTALRAEAGLRPQRDPLFHDQHSPHLVLALFSSALAQPQPDWPQQTRLCGFAFYDKLRAGEQLPPELASFLDAGPPPVVFTLGSAAVFDPGHFFQTAAQAAVELGRRAVLLVGESGQRHLGRLPPEVAAFDYAPFSALLPRAAAVVHQGGVGTTGQALRAGKPMLVMPYSHDQPDNAARMVRLGVGRTVPRRQFTAARAAAELRALLGDPAYARHAEAVARQVGAEHGAATAADAIETLL